MTNFEKIENRNICAECGGECCKGGGCAYLSTDFEALKTEVIEEALATGRLSITASLKFEYTKNGIPTANAILYLRARNIGKGEIDLVSVPTACASLEEKGCHFDINSRPSDGAAIIPDANKKCQSIITRNELLTTWLPYQGTLRRIVKRHTGKTVEAQVREDIETYVYELLAPTNNNINRIYQLSHRDTLESIEIAYPEEYQRAYKRLKNEIGITRYRSTK